MEEQTTGNNAEIPTAPVSASVPSKKMPDARLRMFAMGLGAVFLISAIASAAWARQEIKKMSRSQAAVAVAKFWRLPAASINGSKIAYSDYLLDFDALKKFSLNPPPGVPQFTDEEMGVQVLERLMANEVIKSLAAGYSLKVQDADVEVAKSKLVAPYPDLTVLDKELKERYGWTLPMYIDRVIRPILLEQKVAAAFASSTEPSEASWVEPEIHVRHILVLVSDPKKEAAGKKSAEAILRRVASGKEDFAALAKKKSEDPGSKEQGGDVGWFARSSVDPDFAKAAFELEPGQITKSPVRTQFGWHIIKVEERRSVKNFRKFLDDKLNKSTVKIFVPIANPFAKQKPSAE